MTGKPRPALMRAVTGALAIAVAVYVVAGGSVAAAAGTLVAFFIVAALADMWRTPRDRRHEVGCLAVWLLMVLAIAVLLAIGVLLRKRIVVLCAFLLAALPTLDNVKYIGQYLLWLARGRKGVPP